jgi:hypothetical protein
MLHDDSSTSSSDEDDLDYLFLDAAFGQGRRLDNPAYRNAVRRNVQVSFLSLVLIFLYKY